MCAAVSRLGACRKGVHAREEGHGGGWTDGCGGRELFPACRRVCGVLCGERVGSGGEAEGMGGLVCRGGLRDEG